MKAKSLLNIFLVCCICSFSITSILGQGVEWARQSAGMASAAGNGVALDPLGNVYTAGYFVGATTFGNVTLNGWSNTDIFVVKYSPSGDVLWAQSAGGTSVDEAAAIRVDNGGNAYITGRFRGPANFGNTILNSTGSDDIFVAKCDSSGAWLWAHQAGAAGGQDTDFGLGIDLDAQNNCYLTGGFEGTATFGTAIVVSSGGHDAFIAKYDSAGNFQWVIQGGSPTGTEQGKGITVDGAGNSYVIGTYGGTATFDTDSITSSGSDDIFIVKYDASGNFQWVQSAGAQSTLDEGAGIGMDAIGNIYVTGFIGPLGTFAGVPLGQNSGTYAAKLSAGGVLQWITLETGVFRYGGIGVDTNGNSYITGTFEGMAIFGNDTLNSPSGLFDRETFVAKFDSLGTPLWALQAGGVDHDNAFDITADNVGNAYFTGDFKLDAFFGNDTLVTDIVPAMFVSKINSLALSLEPVSDAFPTGYRLSQNYPNPFNPTTTIPYYLPHATEVTIVIYNILGQQIRTLVNGRQVTGEQQVVWNGRSQLGNKVSSGIYIYQLQAGEYLQSRKMLLIR